MSGQKTAWVTGGSSGLGLHTAAALKEDGWRVIAVSPNQAAGFGIIVTYERQR